MSIALENYISAGYLLIQSVDSTSYNSWMRSVCHAHEDLLPSKVLSIGLCGTPRAPVFDWAGPLDDDYTHFGVPVERVPELSAWASERFNKEIGYPNIFWSLKVAREYVRQFTNGATDIQIVGMGLQQDDLNIVAEVERFNPPYVAENGSQVAGFQGNGFSKALRMRQSLMPGEILGFDVVCLHYNIDHSWLCTCLAVTALREFGFRPNGFGLIDDRADAEKIANYAGTNKTEDGFWLPILVVRNSLDEV